MARRHERSFDDSGSDSESGTPVKKAKKLQTERRRRSYSDEENGQEKMNYAKRYGKRDSPVKRGKYDSPTKRKEKYSSYEQRRRDSPEEGRKKQDNSSERSKNGKYNSPDRRNEKDSSLEKKRTERYSSSGRGRRNERDSSPERRNEGYDSPERRKNERYGSPERRKNERDNTLGRRRNERGDTPERRRNERENTPERRRNERENSPERRRNERENIPERRRNDRENTPERRRNERENTPERRRNERENTPERRRNERENTPERRRNERENTPERRRNERENTPERRRNERKNSSERRRGERENTPERRNERESTPERRNERKNCLERRRTERESTPDRRNERANTPERTDSYSSFSGKRKRSNEEYSDREERRNERQNRSKKENVDNSPEMKQAKKSKGRMRSKKHGNSEESSSSKESGEASSFSESSDSEDRSGKHDDNIDTRKQQDESPKRRMESYVNKVYDRWQEDSYNRDSRDRETPERDGTKSPEYRGNRQERPRTNDGAETAPPELTGKEDALSKAKIRNVNLKSGGAYIHPAKLKMLQEQITDKSSIEYQRLAWEALKKSLNGLINKINKSNIGDVVREIFKENVVRGRGVVVRAIIQAQAQSSTFTHIYAALVAVINTKFPTQVGELLLKRLLVQFKRGFYRNNKQACLSSCKFIAHLVNQQVAHEITALEILTLLLEKPTDDSVEIAITMLKECGKKLTAVCPKGVTGIFNNLNHILQEANLSMRVHYMIEVMFAIRKDNFKDYEDVQEGLDLVEEEDRITHPLALEDATDAEEILNVFRFDDKYLETEEKYREIRQELLAENSDDDESGSSGDESGSGDEEDDEAKAAETVVIEDMTETSLVALRRNIYLTIQSSLDFEECAHKLLKLELNPGHIVEMCYMILDCCAQQRTYEKFFGLLAQRFCRLNKIYVEPFTEIFKNSYETIHRLETNKLRNVAKFFAHLLYTDAISWLVLSNIRLNEDDTTSSNRIFIKILFQDLSEFMGLRRLFDRVKDVTLQEAFDGLFPRDNPRNTRFAINFFTSIGLGGLTDELREHLKTVPKNVPVNPMENPITIESSSESDSSSSSSSSSASSSSSESDDSMKRRRRKKKEKNKQSKKQETKSRERKNRTSVQKHVKKRR